MRRIRVLLFAGVKEAIGQEDLEIDLDDPVLVGQLRQAMAAAYPEAARLLEPSVFAINEAYADDDAEIPPDAEVACIPPVSGGER